MKVWTFVVVGGEPFVLEVKGNPSLVHDGGKSLWKLVADPAAATHAAMILRDRGCIVDVHVDGQSAEQFLERSGFMPSYTFKCGSCGHRFDLQQGISDPNPLCPKDTTEEADETPATCGNVTEKVIVSGGTFHLKGTGWSGDGYGPSR